MKRVLVTGASGFVGGHLVRALATAGFETIAAGGKRACSAAVLEYATGSMQLDLTDPRSSAEAIDQSRPDAVVHCAALAQGAECERTPEHARTINTLGTELLLRSCEAVRPQPPLFIYISTDLVFDGADARGAPFSEADAPKPISVYSQTKYAAEKLCHEAGLASLVARISLVYGPEIGGNQGAMGWMSATLSQGQRLALFTDEYRTPIYAPDIGATISKLLEHHTRGGKLPPILHIPGPVRCSRFEFGELLAERLGADHALLNAIRRQDIASVPPRPEDTSLRCDSPELLATPFKGCREGLAEIGPLKKA